MFCSGPHTRANPRSTHPVCDGQAYVGGLFSGLEGRGNTMITMFLGPEVSRTLTFSNHPPEKCLIFWHGCTTNSPLLVKIYDPIAEEARVKKMPWRDVRTKTGEEQIRNSERK